MTLTSILPRLAGNGSHRIQDENDRLKRTVAKLRRWQEQANDYFQRLTADRAEVYVCWQDEHDRRLAAETVASQMQSDRDAWRAEALALRARFGAHIAAEANANRVNVPPMQRIGADQETAPQGIDVRSLRDAAAVGPIGPVMDPGHVASREVVS